MGGDAAIEEVASIPVLVKLGLEVVTDKEMAQGLWQSVKNINLETIKSAAVDFYNNKVDAYTSDKPYIVGYTAGKDAVQIATMLSGVGVFKKGAKEGLERGLKETGDIVKKKADDVFESTWKLSKQKLGRSADSKVLGENMEAIGKARPDNSAAHHIVAGGSNNVDAKATRKLLEDANIDINEATNGVFLPRDSKYLIDEATSHASVHTSAYYTNVYDRLKYLSKEDIRDELLKIADELSKGTFPY